MIFSILITCALDNVLIVQGEVIYWSLLFSNKPVSCSSSKNKTIRMKLRTSQPWKHKNPEVLAPLTWQLSRLDIVSFAAVIWVITQRVRDKAWHDVFDLSSLVGSISAALSSPAFGGGVWAHFPEPQLVIEPSSLVATILKAIFTRSVISHRKYGLQAKSSLRVRKINDNLRNTIDVSTKW